MKFLLAAVNAKYIHSNPAIYSLKAYAGEGLREHVELAEYTINQYMQDILADIYNRRPDVIGFSCYIWNWMMIQELLAELPKLLPDTDIWLGGPEVSYDADKIMEKYPRLTGIMIGEGEATFKELAEYYLKRETEKETAGKEACPENKKTNGTEGGKMRDGLEKIPGLYLSNGYTAMRPLTDMSSIPFLYNDLTPFENKIIYYETSRGCPYRCSYCLSSIDKSVRLRDISVVKKELQFFLDNRVKQVKFVDRTFNCNHEHAMEVWKYIRDNDNSVTNFHFEISADILRRDEIELLNSFRPGLAQLEIGVQSVNPDTLRAIKRIMNVERLESIVADIHKGRNIHQHLDLIAGLPYEDYESFGKSFDRVYKMKPEQLQLGFLKVLKGSEMWERAEEYGIRYLDKPPYEVLYTKWLSYADVLRLKGVEEMVELYYNSGQFTRTIPVLVQVFESPFAMYEKLAEFYREKGYATNSPARIYRYQILLDFAEKYDKVRLPLYRELLTCDMYLRENLKSRPDFAADISLYKESIREFYRREEIERRYLPDYAGYDRKQLEKMTHLEPFVYPVWREAFYKEDRERQENHGNPGEVYFVLFDYRCRNPLNYEAEMQIISCGGKASEALIPGRRKAGDTEGGRKGLSGKEERI